MRLLYGTTTAVVVAMFVTGSVVAGSFYDLGSQRLGGDDEGMIAVPVEQGEK